jgi:hypothetical protein
MLSATGTKSMRRPQERVCSLYRGTEMAVNMTDAPTGGDGCPVQTNYGNHSFQPRMKMSLFPYKYMEKHFVEIQNVESDECLWRVSLTVSSGYDQLPSKHLDIDSTVYSRILLNVCVP